MFEGMNDEEKSQFTFLTQDLDSGDLADLVKLIDEFGLRCFRDGVGSGRG